MAKPEELRKLYDISKGVVLERMGHRIGLLVFCSKQGYSISHILLLMTAIRQ